MKNEGECVTEVWYDPELDQISLWRLEISLWRLGLWENFWTLEVQMEYPRFYWGASPIENNLIKIGEL